MKANKEKGWTGHFSQLLYSNFSVVFTLLTEHVCKITTQEENVCRLKKKKSIRKRKPQKRKNRKSISGLGNREQRRPNSSTYISQTSSKETKVLYRLRSWGSLSWSSSRQHRNECPFGNIISELLRTAPLATKISIKIRSVHCKTHNRDDHPFPLYS